MLHLPVHKLKDVGSWFSSNAVGLQCGKVQLLKLDLCFKTDALKDSFLATSTAKINDNACNETVGYVKVILGSVSKVPFRSLSIGTVEHVFIKLQTEGKRV